MKKQNHFNKNILYLHIAVMLLGLSGVIAQYVEVPAIMAALGAVALTNKNS